MNGANHAQNSLKSAVGQYFNGCVSGGWGRLVATTWPELPCRLQAKSLSQQFLDVQSVLPAPSHFEKVYVDPYLGHNPYVHQMRSCLASLKDDLIGACVHGSLGTFDEVAYSDFDALVIIRSEVFEDPARLRQCAAKLGQLRRVMYAFDPLQHHGWFVLTELDLGYYCDAYFPIALFPYAKSILGGDSLTFSVSLRDSESEIKAGFLGLANSIIRNIEESNRPKTMYQLKCVTSTIMLLPALYLHTRYGVGVYKRETFDLAKQDFPSDVWAVMDEVSKIRDCWEYELSWWRRYVLSNSLALRKYTTHGLSPSIPKELNYKLDEAFYESIRVLVHQMIVAATADG